MAVPTAYTEDGLKTYMHAMLGAVATALSWDPVAGDYDEAVIETLLAYGVAGIASATDMTKLRALARREVWRAVMAETAMDYDFAADGGRYDRSQMHEQAMGMWETESMAALVYDDGYAVEEGELVWDYDPYAVPE